MSREMGVTRKRSNFDEKGQGPRGGSMHWPGAMVWHGTDRVFGGTGSPGGQSRSCECRCTKLASFSRQGEVCSYDTSIHCDYRINFVFIVMRCTETLTVHERACTCKQTVALTHELSVCTCSSTCIFVHVFTHSLIAIARVCTHVCVHVRVLTCRCMRIASQDDPLCAAQAQRNTN